MAQTPEPILISILSTPSASAESICDKIFGISDIAIVRTDETPPSIQSLSDTVAAFMRDTSNA